MVMVQYGPIPINYVTVALLGKFEDKYLKIICIYLGIFLLEFFIILGTLMVLYFLIYLVHKCLTNTIQLHRLYLTPEKIQLHHTTLSEFFFIVWQQKVNILSD